MAPRGLFDVRQDQRCPVLGETLRDRGAEAVGSAGDQDATSAEIEVPGQIELLIGCRPSWKQWKAWP